MIQFQSKPDSIFCELLERALNFELDLWDEESPLYLPKKFLKAFGGNKKLKKVLESILQHLKSDQLVMPSDYMFCIMWYELKAGVEVYNDMVHDGAETLMYKGQPVKDINFDRLVETFFWDEDFFIPEMAGASGLLKQAADISNSAIRASTMSPADSDDYKFEPVKPREGWDGDMEEALDYLWLHKEMEEV